MESRCSLIRFLVSCLGSCNKVLFCGRGNGSLPLYYSISIAEILVHSKPGISNERYFSWPWVGNSTFIWCFETRLSYLYRTWNLWRRAGFLWDFQRDTLSRIWAMGFIFIHPLVSDPLSWSCMRSLTLFLYRVNGSSVQDTVSRAWAWDSDLI